MYNPQQGEKVVGYTSQCAVGFGLWLGGWLDEWLGDWLVVARP